MKSVVHMAPGSELEVWFKDRRVDILANPAGGIRLQVGFGSQCLVQLSDSRQQVEGQVQAGKGYILQTIEKNSHMLSFTIKWTGGTK
jgi:hypothetical protein